MKGRIPTVPGIEHARDQSKHGPKFGTGECLMQTEIAMFGRHAFGGDTAANGWKLAQHRHPFTHGSVSSFLSNVPRGFPVWFAGGTPTEKHPEGCGHIVISGTTFFCWSVDRLRDGYWDRVETNSILTWNKVHPQKLLGWSEDIGGVLLPYKPHSMDRK